MSDVILWPMICLMVGLSLIIAEVFLPSGGLLGLSAVLFIGASLWLAFSESFAVGVGFLTCVVVLAPIAIGLAVHLWPRTPMGKWLFLKPPGPEDLDPAAEEDAPRVEYLLGQYGRCLTPLRPSGTVEIEGRRVDGLAEEGMIAAGALVRAVRVRGGQVVVREEAPEGLGDLLSESAIS